MRSGLVVTFLFYPVEDLAQNVHRCVLSYNRDEVVARRRAAGLPVNLDTANTTNEERRIQTGQSTAPTSISVDINDDTKPPDKPIDSKPATAISELSPKEKLEQKTVAPSMAVTIAVAPTSKAEKTVEPEEQVKTTMREAPRSGGLVLRGRFEQHVPALAVFTGTARQDDLGAARQDEDAAAGLAAGNRQRLAAADHAAAAATAAAPAADVENMGAGRRGRSGCRTAHEDDECAAAQDGGVARDTTRHRRLRHLRGGRTDHRG